MWTNSANNTLNYYCIRPNLDKFVYSEEPFIIQVIYSLKWSSHFHNSFILDKSGIRLWQNFDYNVRGQDPIGKYMWLPLWVLTDAYRPAQFQKWLRNEEGMEGKESDMWEDAQWPGVKMMTIDRAVTSSLWLDKFV